MKIRLVAFVLLCQLIACTPGSISWTAIGDSITYLNDHHDETGYRITNGYMAMVAAQHPNIKYINQGHNGWTPVYFVILNIPITKESPFIPERTNIHTPRMLLVIQTMACTL